MAQVVLSLSFSKIRDSYLAIQCPMSFQIDVKKLNAPNADMSDIQVRVEMVEMQSEHEDCENDSTEYHQEKLLHHLGAVSFIFDTTACAKRLTFKVITQNISRSFELSLNEASSDYLKLSTESE